MYTYERRTGVPNLKNQIMKNKTFDNYNLVLMYAFNYEYNFRQYLIEKAFPRDEFNTDHFVKKFNHYCDESEDDTLGFMKFYASLSDRNKMTLVDYMLNDSEFKNLYKAS